MTNNNDSDPRNLLSSSSRLARGILRRVRRVDQRADGNAGVLQPAAPLDPLHHCQHRQPARGCQEHEESQQHHLLSLHRLSGKKVGKINSAISYL